MIDAPPRASAVGDTGRSRTGETWVEIVVADIGGTHARFALAELRRWARGGPRRGRDPEDGGARQPADRLGGLRRARRAQAAGRRRHRHRRPDRGRGAEAHQQPVDHPPGADQAEARAGALHPGQRLRRRRPRPAADGRQPSAPRLRAGRAAAGPGGVQHRRTGNRPGRGPGAPARRPFPRHRDRGRPRRLRPARQPRGRHPGAAAQALSPGLGRARGLRTRPWPTSTRPWPRSRAARSRRATTRRCGPRRWRAATAWRPPRSTGSA